MDWNPNHKKEQKRAREADHAFMVKRVVRVLIRQAKGRDANGFRNGYTG